MLDPYRHDHRQGDTGLKPNLPRIDDSFGIPSANIKALTGTLRVSNRFHIDSGPRSLFERVRFKIRGARDLVLDQSHFKDRESERNFPSHLVLPFDPEQWELLTAEVLKNGKFMKTTWSRVHSSKRWFIVFAKGDIAVTVYSGLLTRRLKGAEIVTSGPLFELVERVNQMLMANEAKGR
jgi:hypothetical protein